MIAKLIGCNFNRDCLIVWCLLTVTFEQFLLVLIRKLVGRQKCMCSLLVYFNPHTVDYMNSIEEKKMNKLDLSLSCYCLQTSVYQSFRQPFSWTRYSISLTLKPKSCSFLEGKYLSLWLHYTYLYMHLKRRYKFTVENTLMWQKAHICCCSFWTKLIRLLDSQIPFENHWVYLMQTFLCYFPLLERTFKPKSTLHPKLVEWINT